MSLPTANGADPTGGPAASANGSSSAEASRVAVNSRSVAVWTMVSRSTGLVRVVAVAAVLGPTYFGNLFQAVNILPNLIFAFITGATLNSLVVPPMVAMIRDGELERLRSLARALVGTALLVVGGIGVLGALASPWLVRLLTLGVVDATVVAEQRRVGALLLALVMPQVALYTVAGIGAAVQNAHGRFALASAAPAVENLGVVAIMVAFAIVHGTGVDLDEIGTAEVVLLGGGSTVAVMCHLAAQLFGAARLGVGLHPRFVIRDPDVAEIAGLMRSAGATAAVQSLRHILALVVAGGVPGGVVALRMAVNFYNLPIGICARPVALASVPELAALFQTRSHARLWQRWTRSIAFALFVAIPVSVGYAVLARPIAQVVAIGEMATPAGVDLLVIALAAMATGLVGETVYWISTSGSLAVRDGRGPMLSSWLRGFVTVVVMLGLARLVEGRWLMAAIGLGLGAGDTAAAVYLQSSVARRLAVGKSAIARSILTTIGASCVAVAAGFGVTRLLAPIPGGLGDGVAAAAAVAVAAVVYVAIHRRAGSPELGEWLGARLGGAGGHNGDDQGRPPLEPRSPARVNGSVASGVSAEEWIGTWPSRSAPPPVTRADDAAGATARRLDRNLLATFEDATAVVVLVGVALISVVALPVEPMLAVGGAVAAALFVIVMAKPVMAAYFYLGIGPLVVGFDRDSVLPLLRPSEALLGLVAAALIWRRAIRLFSGLEVRFDRSRLESMILFMAIASSIVPLLWLRARGIQPEFVDFLYSITIWKFYGLFIVVRTVVESVDQVERCLKIVLGVSVVVAVIAILQSAGIGVVVSFLESLYPSTERNLTNNRGSSLLNSSHAVGDVMVMNLALVFGIAHYKKWSPVLGGLAVLFFVGAFASGQFSAIIGLAIGALVAARLTGSLMASSTFALPLTALATIALRPVVERRLDGFSAPVSPPSSWISRWENLTGFFWPQLTSSYNFLLGVRPAARLPAPEVWRQYVYIESGHTYLLWSGGLPYLMAYVLFTVVALRTTRAVAARRDPVGAAAVAANAGLWVITVLMVLDVHLTLRGTADLLFPLLALVVAGRLIPPATAAGWPLRRPAERSEPIGVVV